VSSGVLGALGGSVATRTFEPATDALRAEVASALEIQRWLAHEVAAAREAGALPIVFAGNCVTSVGTVAGLRAHTRRSPGVCWFDAHADFNTPETSASGFLDGMALAMLTGRCWTSIAAQVPGHVPVKEHDVLLVGARDLDPAERDALSDSEIVWVQRATDVAAQVNTLGRVVSDVYLHIDLDVLDVAEARVNTYSCTGGLTRAQLLDAVRQICSRTHVGAVAFTAYDPACDPEQRVPAIVRELLTVVAQ
jgi:arginase